MTLALPIAIVALAFSILFHAIITYHSRKELSMAVFTELTQPLADLQAAAEALPAKVAAAVAAGDPTSAADKADTIAAVTSGAAAAVAAINSIGAPPQ